MTPALDLDTLVLERGVHPPPNGDAGFCVMEAVAYIAGEPWTDHPECASPIISTFLRSWNDSLPDTDRQILKPLIPRLVGTRTTAACGSRRVTLRRRRGEVAGKVVEPPQTAPTEGTAA